MCRRARNLNTQTADMESILSEIFYRLLVANRHLRSRYTQRIFFEILLNQSEMRLYLPFSDWFGFKQTSVWIQIIRKMVNTISFRVDLIIFRKKFSVRNDCNGNIPICISIRTFFHIYLYFPQNTNAMRTRFDNSLD